MWVRIEARPGIDYNKCGIQIHKPGLRKQGHYKTSQKLTSPFQEKWPVINHGRIQRGGGDRGPPPPGIARLLIFAMLKFSVRPLLGIWTPRQCSGSAHVKKDNNRIEADTIKLNLNTVERRIEYTYNIKITTEGLSIASPSILYGLFNTLC